MSALVLLSLAGTALAATYNYSASVSSTAEFQQELVLCNTTFSAANGTGLFYTQPSFSRSARYGVGLGLAQNQRVGSSAFGLQASLMVYPGTPNYLTNSSLGYEFCAFALNVRGFLEDVILQGHSDDGTCLSMLGDDCISAFKLHFNQIGAQVYNSSAGQGSVSSLCNAIMDKMQQDVPAACQAYVDATHTLVAGNIAVSQLSPASNGGVNESALAASCTVQDGYETWYNINTQLSGGYSIQTYDVITSVVWPIVGIFLPPLNSTAKSIIPSPESDFTCIRIDHYNDGSRVSPALPSGTPVNPTTTASSTPKLASSGFSGGAIAGIVVGVIVIILVVLGAFCIIRRRKANKIEEMDSEAIEIYSKELAMDKKYSEVAGHSISEMSPNTCKVELPSEFSAELHGDHHYELEANHNMYELPADVPGHKVI